VKNFVAIDFACNDPDSGLFAGRASAITYGDAEIEAQNIDGFKFTWLDGAIRIHREVFAIEGCSEWVGNWCWNRFIFRRDVAKKLLFTLRANGWRVTCGPSLLYSWFNRSNSVGISTP